MCWRYKFLNSFFLGVRRRMTGESHPAPALPLQKATVQTQQDVEKRGGEARRWSEEVKRGGEVRNWSEEVKWGSEARRWRDVIWTALLKVVAARMLAFTVFQISFYICVREICCGSILLSILGAAMGLCNVAWSWCDTSAFTVGSGNAMEDC